MRVVSATSDALTPTSIALGNFDGVHRGHQQVILPAVSGVVRGSAMVTAGDRLTASAQSYATVVTFDPHPREFFSGTTQQLLTPLPEKIAALAQLGVEQLVLLPFDRELSTLTPAAFVAEILIKQLRTQQISIGMDFSFGQGRSGNAQDLQAIAAQFGVDVHITPLYCEATERISSSAIRTALQHGELHHANQLLGRPYTLRGEVIHGQKLGRKIGFPTANLKVDHSKFLPKYGVYAVQVRGESLNTQQWGILNIGCRPTVDPHAVHPSIEVHLFDYAQDLYGATLEVDLLHYIRPERKFASLQALQTQIQQDCDHTYTLLTTP